MQVSKPCIPTHETSVPDDTGLAKVKSIININMCKDTHSSSIRQIFQRKRN